MKQISFEKIRNNDIQLPNEEYTAFIICNKSLTQIDLLNKMISENTKELNFYGKWSAYYQKTAQPLLKKLNNIEDDCLGNNSLCESLILDGFICYISKCEKENTCSVLFYDDEELKDFILSRVDQKNSHSFKSEERVELNAHTNTTANIGVSSAEKMVEIADINNLKGIAITDALSTQGFYEAQKTKEALENKDFKVLYGCEIPIKKDYIANVLCKNNNGKKTLYKLLSNILSDNNKEDKNWELLLSENKKDLLIGSGLKGLINLAIVNNQKELEKEMIFYDFVEVAPVNCYKLFDKTSSEKTIKDAIKLIIKTAEKLKKIVVATSSPYYALDDNYLEFSILYNHNNPNNKLIDDIHLHIYSTEEMLYEFYWLDSFDDISNIVINNTHKILNMCESFKPYDCDVCVPTVENADEIVRQLVYDKYHEIYGENSIIEERLEKELKIIKDNGYSSIFYINSEICRISKEQGYGYGTRGLVGNSLVAFFLGISECNPLPAHTICDKCHKLVWLDISDGFNKETTTCECGGAIRGDGHNLHIESFVGIDGQKIPDIDLNLHPEFNKNIVEIIEEAAPGNKVIKGGGYKCISYQKAQEIVNEFAGRNDEVLTYDLKEDIEETLLNVSIGQNTIRMANIIVPNDVDIFDYTPVITINKTSCTHNDYHHLTNYLYKQDCIDHPSVQTYKYIKESGIDFEKIDITDQSIYKFINGSKEYNFGLLGVPELGSKSIMNLIKKVKPQNFEELVKASALGHGTHVWRNNQEELFDQGLPLSKAIATRDDVLAFLLEHDMPMSKAYEIYEYVRKGIAATKDFTEGQYNLFEKYEIPNTFISICKKILYMFPKAHSISYVMNALRAVWLKINKPAYFYADYFTNRADDLKLDDICKSVEEIQKDIIKMMKNDSCEEEYIETLQIAYEMKTRGIILDCDKTIKDGSPIIFNVDRKNENRIICSKVKE